jgi:outer membrane protein assembly factor BamB
MPSTRRRFLSTTTAAAAAAVAGCSAVDGSPYSPGSDADSDWPMPGYGRTATAFNPDAAAPRDGVQERWTTAVPNPSGRPVVADGMAFVPTAAALVALDAASGEEVWRAGDERPWPNAPVVHDGTVYVGFADQHALLALDAADGSEQWRVETRGSVGAPVTFDHDFRRLYAGDDTGRVYRVNPADGTVEDTLDVFGEVRAMAFGRSLLVGTFGGEVYDLYHDGRAWRPLWRRKLDGAVTGLAAPDAQVLAATFGGSLYRLRDGAHAGSSRWEYDRGAIHLAATPHDVVGTDGGGLRVLDERDGEERWRADGSFGCAPAIAGDTLYAGGGEKGTGGSGFVAAYRMDGGTSVAGLRWGEERWRYETESAVMEGLAVADGAVFGVTQGLKNADSVAFALDPA